MDKMDIKAPISIFTSDYQTAEFMKSMRDLASLAGVLKELSTEKCTIPQSKLFVFKCYSVN